MNLKDAARKVLDAYDDETCGRKQFELYLGVLNDALAQPEQEPVVFEEWLSNQHGDPEEIGFLQALRIAYISGQDSITAIKEALAQPEQSTTCGEPVATVQCINGILIGYLDVMQPVGTQLYTTPPQREFVGLTDEQIWDEVKAADLDWQTGWSLDEDASNRYVTFARAIEAAHGITKE